MTTFKIIATLAVVILLSGCAMGPEAAEDPASRIATAKKVTQRAEKDFIGLIPEGRIAKVEQLSTGSFLECSNGYSWAGGISARLVQPDGDVVLSKLAKSAGDRNYSVDVNKSLDGAKRYDIVGPDGVQLVAGVWDEGATIKVSSASPCFELPKDFRRPREY